MDRLLENFPKNTGNLVHSYKAFKLDEELREKALDGKTVTLLNEMSKKFKFAAWPNKLSFRT